MEPARKMLVRRLLDIESPVPTETVEDVFDCFDMTRLMRDEAICYLQIVWDRYHGESSSVLKDVPPEKVLAELREKRKGSVPR